MKEIDQKVVDKLKDFRSSEGVDKESLWTTLDEEFDFGSAGTKAGASHSKWARGALALALLLGFGAGVYIALDGSLDTKTAVNTTAEETGAIKQQTVSSEIISHERQMSLEMSSNTKIEEKVYRNSAITSSGASMPDAGIDQKGSPQMEKGLFQSHQLKETKQEYVDTKENQAFILTEEETNPVPIKHLNQDLESSKPRTEELKPDKPEERKQVENRAPSLDWKTKDFSLDIVDPMRSSSMEYASILGPKRIAPSVASQMDGRESIPKLKELERRFRFVPKRVSIRFGGNRMQSLSSPSESEESWKEASLSAGYGTSVGLFGHWKIGSRFECVAGIRREELGEQFDLNRVRIYSLTLDNHLIGLGQNANGEIIPIYGEHEQAAESRRSVLHNNTYTSISLPIKIGYLQTVGNWGLGLHLGGEYIWTHGQKGRILDAQGELIQFVSNNGPLPNSSFAFLISPSLNYSVNRRWRMGIAPEYSYGERTKSMLDGIDNQLRIARLTMELSYRLR